MTRPARSLALLVCLGLSLPAAVTLADAAPTPAEAAEASRHFKQGIKLVEDQDYRTALLEFRRAYEIAPSTAVLYNLGQCYAQLQDYARALGALEQYLSEGGKKVPADRVKQVSKQIDELRGRVALATITTNVDGAAISVDDEVVGKAPLAGPQRLSAGRRRVTAAFEGRAPVTRTLDVLGGDKVQVELTFAEPAASSAPAASSSPPAPASGPPPALTYAAFGVGAAGLLFGGVMTALALHDKSTLDQTCAAKRCPASDAGAISQMQTKGTLATVGLVVGVVGLGAGLTLLLAAPPRPADGAATARVAPWVGFGAAGLAGTF